MSDGMLRAWIRDSSEEKPEELHQTDPPQFLTQEEVFLKTGVTYWREERYKEEEKLNELKEDGGYKTADFLEMRGLEAEENSGRLYMEHLHEDAEVRLVVAGSLYFEVRDCDDRWIRLHLQEGDLISLPPGIYHRGTVDNNSYCKLYRLFLDLPEWKAHFRPEADNLPVRITYLQEMQATAAMAS